MGQISSPVSRDVPAGMEIKTQTGPSHVKLAPHETSDFQWYELPSPTEDNVTQASIAGDGPVLVIFYRKPRPSLNTDEGIVEKWTGWSWSNVAHVTNECHYPDVDVKGPVVVTTWNDDGYDYGYGTNVNGNWVSMTGTLLYSQWFPRAAMAMGLPYMSFTCKYSDGMPFTYDMLHIRSLVGVGDRIELKGGWTVTYTSVGTKTDITGDDNAWYTVFSQQGYLYVMKGSIIEGVKQYTDLGEGFRMYNPVARPEITLFQGRPHVAWMENGNTELYIAEWDGGQWMVIGSAALSSGTFEVVRMTSSGSQLYVVTSTVDSGSEISVNSYDGDQWYGLPDVQNYMGSSIGTVDIAMHNGSPVVAFTENNYLVIKKFSSSSPTALEPVNHRTPDLSIFPNPTDGIIQVTTRGSGPYLLEIKSLTGQLLCAAELHGTHTPLNMSRYKPGVYLITVGNGEYTETRKVIKH